MRLHVFTRLAEEVKGAVEPCSLVAFWRTRRVTAAKNILTTKNKSVRFNATILNKTCVKGVQRIVLSKTDVVCCLDVQRGKTVFPLWFAYLGPVFA